MEGLHALEPPWILAGGVGLLSLLWLWARRTGAPPPTQNSPSASDAERVRAARLARLAKAEHEASATAQLREDDPSSRSRGGGSSVSQLPQTNAQEAASPPTASPNESDARALSQQAASRSKEAISSAREAVPSSKETPTTAQEPPANSKELPSNTQEPPANSKELPGDTQDPPPTTKELRSNAQEPPATTKESSDNMQEPPATTQKTPADAQKPPTKKNEQSDAELAAKLLEALVGGEHPAIAPQPHADVETTSSAACEWLASRLGVALASQHDRLAASLRAIEGMERQTICRTDARIAESPPPPTNRGPSLDAARRHRLALTAQRQITSVLRATLASPVAAHAFAEHITKNELPEWVISRLADAPIVPPLHGADGVADDARAREQTAEAARRVLPPLLAPLRSLAADSPTPSLQPLVRLLANPAVAAAVAAALEGELSMLLSGAWSGRKLQLAGFLAPLFCIGVPAALGAELNSTERQRITNLDVLLPMPDRDIASAVVTLQRGLTTSHLAAYQLLKRVLTSSEKAKDSVIAWVARALVASSPRCQAIGSARRYATSAERQREFSHATSVSAGDEWLCNLTAVLLRLCAPFLRFQEQPPTATLAKLPPSLFDRSAASGRRVDYGSASRLGGRIVAADAAASSEAETDLWGEVADANPEAPSSVGGEPVSFVAEVFLLTQQALHVGLIPACRMMNFHLDMYALRLKQSGQDPNAQQHATAQYKIAQSFFTHLLHPETLQLSLDFIRLEAAWLVSLLALPPDEARRAFEQVPAYVVLDMCYWLRFVATYRIDELALQPLHRLMRSLASLLRAGSDTLCGGKRLIRSPLVLSELVFTLYVFVIPPRSRRKSSSGLLGGGGWGDNTGDRLSAAVLGEDGARRDLALPLAATYSMLDAVEGLDVDATEAEGFEKFMLRGKINTLLLELWKLHDCRPGLVQPEGSPEREVVCGLANAMLDTLLYQLEEALKRIREVNMADWSDDDALEHNQGYIKHLLEGSTSTLRLLGELTAENVEASLVSIFANRPIGPRTASVSLKFADLLCGPKAVQLKLRGGTADFGFNPRELLQGIATLLVHCAAAGDAFACAIAADVDVDLGVLHKTHRIVEREHLLPPKDVLSLQKLLRTIEQLCAARRTKAAAGEGGGASAILERLSRELGDGGAGDGGASGGPECASSQLERSYCDSMEGEVYDSVDLLGEELKTRHHYASQSASSSGALPALRKAMMREAREFQGGQLPLHPDATVFVRQDETMMNVWRAMLTGPVDTPYALGCFVFDIFCPPEYPAIPPLVHFETTGGGTVKFNPNLYADGKVCLSLIGTFSGVNATEKWDPQRSSLYQVLVSIQSQILVPHPIVNEPGYDSRESSAQSKEYNARLRLDTMRHAMIAQLRNPPVGFESAVIKHFERQRDRILRQCLRWTHEAPAELKEKMTAALGQLHEALPAQLSAIPTATTSFDEATKRLDEATTSLDEATTSFEEAGGSAGDTSGASAMEPAFEVVPADTNTGSDDELYY